MNTAALKRVAGAAVAALIVCMGIGAASAAPGTSGAQRVDPRSLVLLPADLPGPYIVDDRGPGGGFEGVPSDLADAYRSSRAFPWFYAADYGPLVGGRKPSTVKTAVAVLPTVSAARRIYRHARSLAPYFGFYGKPNGTAPVDVGDQGAAFWATGLASGQPARARVVVWRSANVLGFIGIVGGGKALAAEFATRQQKRIERATGGNTIAVPDLRAGLPPQSALLPSPTYGALVPATPNGDPVTIDRRGMWTLKMLGATTPITISPGRQGVSLPFTVAGAAEGPASLRLHVRIDLAEDARPGRELDFVGAIDWRVSVSTRLSAALDPRTGALHIAGDDVTDTTKRRIEFTSRQMVPGGSLSVGAHVLQLRLDPAFDGGLHALRAVVLPDSAIVVG